MPAAPRPSPMTHDRLPPRALILASAVAALIASSAARAQRIYQYTDAEGVTVLTNIAPGSSRRALRVQDQGGIARLSAPPEVPLQRDSAAYAPFIDEACALYKIPKALARAVMAAESNFDPTAVSPRGALGLMQLMPETATAMFVEDAFDPRQNIHGGVRYLRVLANLFEGDMVRIVAAYNAGPDAVRRAGGIPDIAETQDYVRRVIRLYFSYKAP
jgi:soluble lytic murein transglycosylase-like protein